MGEGQLKPLIDRLLHTVGRDGGQLSDAQLLERFALNGDEAAFESLLWRHGPMVLGLCRRVLRHRHDAEDVFQAVFLVFFRKARSIRRRDCLASWLYKVAYRLAVRARVQARGGAYDDLLVESVTAPEKPDAFLAAELRPVLDDALSRLPEKYRAPLVLHYLQGKTVQEAADELGCPAGTVSGRLNRARELMRRKLSRRGVVLSAALVPAALARAGEAAAMTGVLASATRDAVRALAGKSAAAGAASATALALAESATRLLPVARWKIAALALLTVGLAGLSVGLAARRQEAAKLAASAPEAPVVGAGVPWRLSEARPPAAAADEDPLPQGARARLGSQRFAYGGTIHALAVSPDGGTVVGVGQGNALVFWEAATGKRQLIIPGRDVPLQFYAVDFSPDGADVVVGDSRGRAVVIDAWKANNTGSAMACDERHGGNVEAVRFAPDGRTVASAGADGVVRLWAPGTGTVLQTLAGHRGPVHALAFAPDGKLLASAGEDGTLRLWGLTPGAVRRTSYAHKGPVRALAFSTDGKVLATAGTDRRVILWRPDTGLASGEYNLGTVAPLALAFADEKRLAVAAEAGAVRLYDVLANKLLGDYRGLQWAVNAVAVPRDGGKLVAGGQDGAFLRWDVASGQADEPATPGHRGAVWGVAVSADGQVIASGGMDGTVRLWSVATGRALGTFRPAWTTPSGKGYVGAVAFVDGGRAVAAAGADGAIHLWDRQQGAGGHWPAHQGKVRALVGCPGGEFLVSAGDDGAICLWRTATREKVHTYGGVDGVVKSVAVSPGGKRLAAVGDDGSVHLWELATGKALGALAGKGSGLDVVAFSQDREFLAAGGPTAALRLWRASGGEPVAPARWPGAGDKAVALAFAPDGALAWAGDDCIIRLRRPGGAEEVEVFPVGHQTRITALAFTPDGKSLVSSSWDGTLLIWNVPGGRRQ
jgi:RNA polymerase sigma factor (sigma-70 family)